MSVIGLNQITKPTTNYYKPQMATGTKELHFEEDVVKYLTRDLGKFAEYTQKDATVYNKELCLIEEDVIDFIKDTQPKVYEAIQAQYGLNTDAKIIQNLVKSIKTNKTLKTLREGQIKMVGQTIKMCFFKPNHDRSPEHYEAYKKNKLTVIRQLKYSRLNENSIDVVLFVNGLPVVTMELKNALTGQYLEDAKNQYRNDRDPKESIFEFQRCLVHFAVSTEEVAMTTRLAGKSTFFLPFNKELRNVNSNGFATAYLWEEVLTKDSLLDLIQNFINLQVNEDKIYNPTKKEIETKKAEVFIFPRFHQRRAVKNILADVKEKGVGQKYLIQHSAGSGKSNTISWLAHRLSDFYQNPSDKKALFDSTIVVTDRRVLDKQIQDNIRQFEQEPGAVAYIDENKTSKDLKEAIEQGKRVIVTTLQKFPVISETVKTLKDRNYAVIIDEAHSSQSGEAARHLRKTLSLEEAEKEEAEKDLDEIILDEIKSKGDQPNISFFAFTATPKQKTIEIFGTKDENGNLSAFDTYTMEQAIKEGFILHVLKNYMSWKRYYKLVIKNQEEDKEYEKKKAVRVLSNYVDLKDHAIEMKSRIMIEHFISNTQHQIQGTARAMLVTKSRLHAVRYKLKFDAIMEEMNLPYRALVAFSGTVHDPETGQDYTEASMNNLGGNIKIPDALKLPNYRMLIVANKYQTGFDEPMLHTMFVDKKLGGTSTVQTLSRLNRTKKGKESTMVLDFVNDPEQIQQDFQQYYGSNNMELDDQTDPNSLYDILNKIENYKLIYTSDLNAFADLFFKKGDHKEKLQPILKEIGQRFLTLDEEDQINFKADCNSFVRLYRFLAQIISFTDVELEKYYVLLVALLKSLPKDKTTLPYHLVNDVELDSYKLQHQFTTELELESGDAAMQGMTPGGAITGTEDELELLTKILKVLNDTYGLELKEEDRIDFLRMKDKVEKDENLNAFFNPNNTKANIRDKFEDVIDDVLLDFVNTKLDLYNKLTDDKINTAFKQFWFNELYKQRMSR